MIKIDRDSPPKNTVMDNKKTLELEKIRSAICKNEKKDIKELWQNKKVKNYLYNSQHGKCCYCERKRDLEETEVDHFRPKAEVKESKGHPGYWWLAYEWDNLLITCKTCNLKKSSKFPLQDENKRAFKEHEDIKKEKPILINPLTENPEDFIEYDIPEDETKPLLMIKVIGKNERGEETIKALTGINGSATKSVSREDKTVDDLRGINSESIMLERVDKLNHYKILLLLNDNVKIKNMIKNYMKSSSEFAGMARYYFNGPGKKKLKY